MIIASAVVSARKFLRMPFQFESVSLFTSFHAPPQHKQTRKEIRANSEAKMRNGNENAKHSTVASHTRRHLDSRQSNFENVYRVLGIISARREGRRIKYWH